MKIINWKGIEIEREKEPNLRQIADSLAIYVCMNSKSDIERFIEPLTESEAKMVATISIVDNLKCRLRGV